MTRLGDPSTPPRLDSVVSACWRSPTWGVKPERELPMYERMTSRTMDYAGKQLVQPVPRVGVFVALLGLYDMGTPGVSVVGVGLLLGAIILAALEDPPDGLAELRGVLMNSTSGANAPGSIREELGAQMSAPFS